MKIRIHKRENHGRTRWVVDWLTKEGDRERRFFGSKAEAEAEASTLNHQRRHTGEVWLGLNSDQRNELLSVFDEIAGTGRSLREVWQGFQRHASAGGTGVVRTLAECIEETIQAKELARRRPTYISSLNAYLKAFAKGRTQVRIDALGVADIEKWFNSRKEAPATRAANLGRLSAMFDLAWRRGYIQTNPCRRVERVHVEPKPPKILSVGEATQLLSLVRHRHSRGLAWFALALMAGIRPEECDRLSWAVVNLDQGIVTVDAAASKVRQRRIVHLQPAAVAWLRLAKALEADLPLPKVTRRRYQRAIREDLGWKKGWPQDILRHTCASYLMAAWQDAGRVAAELGNSPGILLRHYRELVRREDAENFWKVLPLQT